MFLGIILTFFNRASEKYSVQFPALYLFFFSPNFMDFLVVVFGFYGFINVDIFSLLSLVLECDVCF